MAIDATEVYAHHGNLYNHKARDRRRRERRHHVRAAEPALQPHISQSMAINRIQSGAIILAGSGMCNGGRIRHHLKHNVWREQCHVIFTGFQARGTLGRQLVDGAPRVRLWGESIRVAAQLHTIGGLSAHADQEGLLAWYRGFGQPLPPVALVHGEPTAIDGLAARLKTLRAPVIVPTPSECLDLTDLPH